MAAWIIESAISLIVFYLAYIFFLKNVTFFQANRYYLLTAIIFSLVMPYIRVTPPVNTVTYSWFIPEVTVAASAPEQASILDGSGFTIIRLLLAVYLGGAVILFIRLFLRLMQLYVLARWNRTERYGNGWIVSFGSGQSPFSFFNYIFINESLYDEEEKEKILEHEMAHIRQYHTLDLILLELLSIIQWFNPVSWLYRRSMLEIHEYLADEEVIKKGTSIPLYQGMLMKLQLGREFFSPANNFNKSLTLNRIRMMTKIKPPAWERIRFFILLPFLALLVFTCTKNGEEISSEGDASGLPLTATEVRPFTVPETQEKSDFFYIVEEMPDFQGKGQNGFRDYIAENLRYPLIAAENGIEGRVFVQFVVKADGTVADAKIVRGVHPSLDREAIRVVMYSPRWEPGKQRGQAVNVAYTFPINFVLRKEEAN
jgi:TonB family protein